MKSRRPVNCYVNVKGQGTTPTNGFCLRCSVYCFNLRETDCYSWPDSMVVTLSWMRPSLTGAWVNPESPGPLSQKRISQLLREANLRGEIFCKESSTNAVRSVDRRGVPWASGLLCGQRRGGNFSQNKWPLFFQDGINTC